MSAFNPFRANPLSPSSTGASVNTVTSYNPPPSFHSVARDDETTVYFDDDDDVDELPVIAEESEGSELSRTGTVMSSGTWRGDEETEGTRTPTRSQTPLIDLDHSLPPTPTLSPTPEIRIQVEEPLLPPLPLSPRSTGSRSRSRSRTSGDDDVDFPAPLYPDDLPPAYTPVPDSNHGEATLEVGPRRPFQQPPRTTRLSAPTPTNLASTPTVQANNASSSPASPSPGPRPFSSLNSGRRGRLGAIQQWTEQIMDQLEQVTNSTGVGNLRSSAAGAGAGASSTALPNNRPSQGQAQQVPRHARSVSDLGSRTTRTNEIGGRLSPLPPSLPPRLSPNPTGGSTHSASSANTVNTRNSAPASTANASPSIPSNANSDFARDFYAAGTGEELLHLDPPSDDDDDDVPLGMRRTGSGASGDVRSRSSEGLGTSSALANAPSASGSNGGTDDDRPTTQPVPGRALLRDGKILVYPKGFTCPKCFNIGYKRADTKNPCKKCWKKYAKPYSPVMSYAPDAGSTTTVQRPLPKPTSTPSTLAVPGGGGGATASLNSTTRPSTLRRPPQHSLQRPTPSVPNLHAGSNTMPGGFPPPSPTLRTTPTGCNHPFHARSPPPANPVIPTSTLSYMQQQRTGSAVVYSAGDPRLGGRRCWQCAGTGTVSYLFFDNSMCMECSGIGRIYR